MRDLRDPADLDAVRGDHVEVDELVVVVLVLVLGQLLRVDLGDQEGVAQGLGAGAVADALEAQEEAAAVDTAGLDGERPAVAGSVASTAPGASLQFRLVGTYLDGDLALDAMGAADPCDYQLHVSSLLSMPSTCGPGTALWPSPARAGAAISVSGRGPRRRGRRGHRGRRWRPRRCAGRVRCGRCGRSPCRGRPGGPGPRAPVPRRRLREATCTSSGLSTMPFTRCSRASSSMLRPRSTRTRRPPRPSSQPSSSG